MGDGTYQNPVLFADYSDPDVLRVGSDYYLVASSFDAVPGLPILHSKDLVHWELIGHALPTQVPVEVYRSTQHGNGAWAPSIRFHAGEYFIFYPRSELWHLHGQSAVDGRAVDRAGTGEGGQGVN